jgi:DNA invertase Pin-like site-specific DNA recombinase
MIGQRIGYIRVSTFDQNPERQLDAVTLDRTFIDKASGKDTKRPELEALMKFTRTGDTVVVHSMDRLARNLDDLRRIVQVLTHRGVCIEFVKEHLSFTGEDSPMANLMLSVMGAFAEFERALIRERQREGITLAKQRGAYRGRKKSLSDLKISELLQRVERGDKKAQVARDLGISRETLYQYLRELLSNVVYEESSGALLPLLNTLFDGAMICDHGHAVLKIHPTDNLSHMMGLS